ncbi:MAG: S8 family serine peptidase [Bacteroidetes bacterium]|nr:S8 family serine peptidase [Bacteroidota bacterium]
MKTKPRKSLFISFIVLFAILIPNFSFGYNNKIQKSPEVVPGIIYVKFKSHSKGLMKQQSVEQEFSKYQILSSKNVFDEFKSKFIVSNDLESVYKIELSYGVNIWNVISEMKSNPEIEYAEPSYIRKTSGDYTPNDSLFSQMYSLAKTQASKAWDISKGDSVIIGIVDSGYDYNHPDLATKIWENNGEKGTDSQNRDKKSNGVDDDNNGFVDDWRGWDFVGSNTTTFVPDNDPHPKSGSAHGTHTSGTAGAATDNRIGVASMGFNAKIMATKHAPDVTSNSIYFGYDGILYCIKNKAQIISCSWGGTGYSQYERDVVRFALKNNVLIVAAAGNGGINTEIEGHYPSNYPEVLAVGNTDSNDKKESLSNFGKPEYVQVFAPGTNILSTIPNGNYTNGYTGTSMSSPLVAGIAALLKSKYPTMSATDIMFRICGTADSIDNLNPSYKGLMGYGRVNAFRSLTQTHNQPKPILVLKSVSINDQSGNNNKSIDPGESVNILVELQNDWGDATNVTATLEVNHWAVTSIKSTSNYGLIKGLSNLDSSSKDNSADPLTLKFSAETIPVKVPCKLTVKADGGISKVFNFELSVGASILFVDDDEDFNSEIYYFKAFKKLGVVYEYWNHFSSGTPSYDILKNYNIVVWSCEWAFPALDSMDRNALKSYLDNGGRLFLSGQDIGWDLADPSPTYPNEFNVSKGASKTFYEKYLKTKYIDDGSATNTSLVGYENDPITNGLSIDRFQPGRAATEQFGDITDTTQGSTPIFKFTNGSSLAIGKFGAVKFEGNYMLVHFTMGGFEAITDTTKQTVVMNRILNWLFKTSVSVDKIFDTENTTSAINVNTKVTSADQIQTVDLYWDTDGQLPFKKVSMSSLGSGNYKGEIPAQTVATVQYFVLVKTNRAFMPYEINSFKVGPDQIKPIVKVQDTLQNSIKLIGPFELFAEMTDNFGIDTVGSKTYYNVNNGQDLNVSFTSTAKPNLYNSKIIPTSKLKVGDIVNYYVIAQDKSSQKNQSRFPISGYKSFLVGKEVLDDFELDQPQKWIFGSWGYSPSWSYAPGKRSITDSPIGNYNPNSTNSLTYNSTINLTDFTKANLSFKYRSLLHNSDTLFFEISKNGGTSWETISKLTDLVLFGDYNYDLNNYLTSNNLKFRFRLTTDASIERDGIYLDYVEINTNQYSVGVNAEKGNLIPKEITLSQNYPNPFNPSTTIRFGIPTNDLVKLEIYDLLGRKTETLINSELNAGFYNYKFDAIKYSSGTYFYRLNTSKKSITKQMRILK